MADEAMSPRLQGTVQGALQGARALAQGIGPPIFAGLFALTTASWSPLPYFPGTFLTLWKQALLLLSQLRACKGKLIDLLLLQALLHLSLAMFILTPIVAKTFTAAVARRSMCLQVWPHVVTLADWKVCLQVHVSLLERS